MPLPIHGSDLHGRLVDAARLNLRDADLDRIVSLKQVNLLELRPPSGHGVLVTNPPVKPVTVTLRGDWQSPDKVPKVEGTILMPIAGRGKADYVLVETEPGNYKACVVRVGNPVPGAKSEKPRLIVEEGLRERDRVVSGGAILLKPVMVKALGAQER